MVAAVQNDRLSNCTPYPSTGWTTVLLVLGHARFVLFYTSDHTRCFSGRYVATCQMEVAKG